MLGVRSRLDIRPCTFQAPDLALRRYGDLLRGRQETRAQPEPARCRSPVGSAPGFSGQELQLATAVTTGRTAGAVSLQLLPTITPPGGLP
jgi:hypothetical protein